MPVTQKIIADHLGIARSVVAEALGGHPRIAAHTRERVRIAARELGYDYTTNREARALIGRRYNRRAKSGIVAVLSPASGGPFAEDVSAYFRPFMDGASIAAYEKSVSLLLCSHLADSVPNVVVDGTVDGVIVLGYVSESIRDQMMNLRVPIVCVAITRQWETSSVLYLDERDGGRQIGRHLIRLGHRRIAFLGHYAEVGNPLPRLAGLRDAMREVDMDIDSRSVETSIFCPTAESVDAAIGKLLERSRDFTGLFCHNDTFAMHAIRALHARRIEVPRDVSVVGFDDLSSQLGFYPTITSVRSSRFEMGRRSVELITDDPDKPPVEVAFPVRLVERNSTGKAPRVQRPV